MRVATALAPAAAAAARMGWSGGVPAAPGQAVANTTATDAPAWACATTAGQTLRSPAAMMNSTSVCGRP